MNYDKEYAVYIKENNNWKLWSDRFNSEDECIDHIAEEIERFKSDGIYLTEDDFMYREMTIEEIKAYD